MRGSTLTRGDMARDPGVVDLWTLPEHRVAELADRMGGTDLLSPDERARHRRLLRASSRHRFLGGRLLGRLALSARTGLPPDAWQFTPTRHGRPEPAPDRGGLRFNLSHTDGLIVCVVTRGRGCGVDVERVPFDDDKTRLLDAFLGGPPRTGDQGIAVCERWVLTEAYLKGLGVGLGGGGLQDLGFRRHGGGRFTVADRRRTAVAARWHLQLVRPSPDHLVAVATEGGGTVRRREPDVSAPLLLPAPPISPS